MLITGENPNNIRGPVSSLSEDQFQGEKFDYMITNPPFGVSWKSEKEIIENENTLYFAIYNSSNQRSYITVKLQ